MKKLFLAVCLVGLSTCTPDKNPLGVSDSDFGFYFLQDNSITLYNYRDKTDKEMAPQQQPWLSARDIDFYDFSSHCIYLKKKKSDIFPGFEKDIIGYFGSMTKPFWVPTRWEQSFRVHISVRQSGANRTRRSLCGKGALLAGTDRFGCTHGES